MKTDLWNRFEKLAVISDGGMGELIKAHDKQTGDIVAIKKPRKSACKKPELIARFNREGHLMQRITHPGFVSMLEALDTPACPALVLEFVEGRTLRELLAEKISEDATFSVEEFLPIASQIIDAVAYLHTFPRIIHRDLKPENIIIDGAGTVKICDLGIALALNDTRITETDIKVGTRPYMAPERYDISTDDASPAIDVFSLGVLFFEMLAGALPSTSPHKELADHGVPAELAEVALKCLEPDRKARYANGAQLKLALESVSSATTETGISPNERPDIAQDTPYAELNDYLHPVKFRFSAKWIGAVTAALLFVAGITAWAFTKSADTEGAFPELIPDEPFEETASITSAPPETIAMQPEKRMAPDYDNGRVAPGSERATTQKANKLIEIANSTGRLSEKKSQKPRLRTVEKRAPVATSRPTPKKIQLSTAGKYISSARKRSPSVGTQKATVSDTKQRLVSRSSSENTAPAEARPQASAKAPKDSSANAYLSLAAQNYSAGDLKSADVALKNAAEQHPEDTGPILLRGWLMVEMGRNDAALALWRRALSANPGEAHIASAIQYLENL